MLYDWYVLITMLKDKLVAYVQSSATTVERQNGDSTMYDDLTNICQPPTQIIDNIYIGNAYNAAHWRQLQELNIKSIVNVTAEIPNYYEDYIDYCCLSIYDDSESHISNLLVSTIAFIKAEQNKNKDATILVHCFMGRSRSVAIVVAYLHVIHKYTIDDAIEFVKAKRSWVNINKKFYDELLIFSNRNGANKN